MLSRAQATWAQNWQLHKQTVPRSRGFGHVRIQCDRLDGWFCDRLRYQRMAVSILTGSHQLLAFVCTLEVDLFPRTYSSHLILQTPYMQCSNIMKCEMLLGARDPLRPYSFALGSKASSLVDFSSTSALSSSSHAHLLSTDTCTRQDRA
jgi:hypothetical protein